MKVLLGLLILAASASTAHAANDTDMASNSSPWPGIRREAPPQIGYFPLPDVYSVGLGTDGTYIWISAGDQAGPPCKFYLFDEDGNQIDVGAQGGGATGWGHRDLCYYDGGVVLGSFSDLVGGHSYAGSGLFVYEGYFYGAPINPNRALAWDGTYFYTGGFGTNLCRLEWSGAWGSSAVVTDLGGPYSGTYGLAYAGDQVCLWMTTASYTGEIYQFDTMGNVLNVFVDPSHSVFGGCEVVPTTHHGGYGAVLAALVQEAPDGVVFYDVVTGPFSPVEPASWGQIKALF